VRLGLCLVLCETAVWSQVAVEANKDYQKAESRSKIAAGLASESRDARQKPKELIAAIGIKPGMTVADVGTGAGYMLKHLAEAVGPNGTVYAEDVFPDFIEAAKKTAGGAAKNIRYVLGNAKSSELPAGSQDLILVLDAFHHFDYPVPMLASLRRALRPDGRMVVVEYHKNEKAMPNGRALTHIRATREEFVKEIEAEGFRPLEVKDFTPDVQWMAIFGAP
jgi:ubiquinone/menaquinone biosynthesis C-methylase UbiE